LGWLEALILGIIQGLTEFLPVSSSGHLELTKALFGGDHVPAESMFFTVAVHGGTALSTVFVFRKDIVEIVGGLFKGNKEQLRFSVRIILSMIPAAVVGLLFEDEISMLFDGQILLVGMMLILTGLLLFLADRAKNTNRNVGVGHSILIGIAQAIAILPGISRSGATISTSVLLGIDRVKAARFSFLMVVPLILGKIAKDLLDGGGLQTQLFSMEVFIGFLAAFITGWFACKWMIRLVQKSQLKYFSYYCFIVAALAITFHFSQN